MLCGLCRRFHGDLVNSLLRTLRSDRNSADVPPPNRTHAPDLSSVSSRKLSLKVAIIKVHNTAPTEHHRRALLNISRGHMHAGKGAREMNRVEPLCAIPSSRKSAIVNALS